MKVTHRSQTTTAANYAGIPMHAAPGIHERAAQIFVTSLPPGARIIDLGAGQGAFSQRLKDAGFHVIAVDVSSEGWRAKDIDCHVCDLDGNWQDVLALGPFDGVAALEVIEHLENPRDFLRKISQLPQTSKTLQFVVSTPNPLDTFSCITMFRRGTFNWFSPDHYGGGGHISILPYWMIDKHLEYLGQDPCKWSFHSEFEYGGGLGSVAYSIVSKLRRWSARGHFTDHIEGIAAVGHVSLINNMSGQRQTVEVNKS